MMSFLQVKLKNIYLLTLYFYTTVPYTQIQNYLLLHRLPTKLIVDMLVRKDMDVNVLERLSNNTPRHKIK